MLWWAYAPVVTFVVVATANHWWLDGFLGAVVALVAALCAHGVFARARPEVWAWNVAPRTQAAPRCHSLRADDPTGRAPAAAHARASTRR